MQQARNLAFSFGERFEDVKFLIRDRGSNFTASFDAVFQAAGTRILRTAVQAPRMNAICERLVGTLRPELLDRLLVLGEAHLRIILAGYQVHYNTARPHQGIAQRAPDGEHDGGLLIVADLERETDPAKTRPGRPDQRILTRRLTSRRTAGHDTDPIFERDRIRRSATRRTPCVRSSRTRLTDDLPGMVTLPWIADRAAEPVEPGRCPPPPRIRPGAGWSSRPGPVMGRQTTLSDSH